LESIAYEWDRLKKRIKLEVTWIFPVLGHGQMKWADKYLNTYYTMTKVANYYLGVTGDKKLICNNLHMNEKYSDLLQMFTDNLLELEVKYRFYNFMSEKLYVISCVHPQDLYNGYKPHSDECIEVLKRIHKIMECSFDPATYYYTYTDSK
jgi:hypothetical protein